MSATIARNHLDHGEWRLAMTAAEGALQACTDDERGPLYAVLARALVRLGEPTRALLAAREATGPDAALALGEALVASGDAHPARALLAETLDDARARADLDAEIAVGIALAEACRAAGDPETGLGLATRVVALAEERDGRDAPRTAEALHQLGVCVHGAGQPGRAAVAFERALAIRRKTAPETVLVALTLDALGRARRKQGEPFVAAKLHREALTLWERALGERAGPVGACRHSLAQAVHNTGDFRSALDEMRLAWLITARTLGEGHVDTHITAFELGRFELDVGQVEEGLRRMEQARRDVSRRLGRDHPVVRSMDRWL